MADRPVPEVTPPARDAARPAVDAPRPAPDAATPVPEAARVEYRVGSEDGPDGRFELALLGNAGVWLSHRHRGVHRVWTARVDAVVWPRLLDALRASDFPRMPPVGRSGPVQELVVRGVEPAGAVWMRRGDGAAVGLTGALRILDSLAHQASNGVLPGEGTLPRVVHAVTAAGGEGLVAVPTAAFGVLAGRPVAGVVRVDGGVDVVAVDGARVAALPAVGPPVRAVAFGDAGQPDAPLPVIVTGGDDGVLRVWSATGDALAVQARHPAPVTAITTTVASTSLRIWSADLAGGVTQRSLLPGVPPLSFPDPKAGVTAIGWAGTPAYQVLVLGLADGRVLRRSVQAADDAEVGPRHGGPVTAVALIGVDDDLLIASAGTDGVIRLTTGFGRYTPDRPWPDLPSHGATVTGLSFGLIGDRLVLGSCALDGTVRTCDPHTGEVLAAWPAGDDWPAGLADARVGGVQRWATGGADGVVRVWDAATGAQVVGVRPPGDPGAVLCLATARLPGRTLVAAGYQDGTFALWDAADGTVIGVDRSSAEPLTSVEFGHDGRLDAFVCGTLAGSVRAYDPASAEFVTVLTPHTDQVLALAVGRGLIVSGGADRTVRVWAARTGWPLRVLTGHTDLVTVVALGEVGGRAVVASGGYDRTVRLWDLETGAPGPRLVTRSTVYALTVAGAHVVTGGLNDAVRVFDTSTGRQVLATDPVRGAVTSVATGVWRGREVVVAAGADAGVRCWTLPTGEPVPVTGQGWPPAAGPGGSPPAGPGWPPLAVTVTDAGDLCVAGTDGVTVVVDRSAGMPSSTDPARMSEDRSLDP